MVHRGEIRSLKVGSLVRITEWEAARKFGLERPGPRTLEIEEDNRQRASIPRTPEVFTHHWVYFLHNEADELLYVGITCTGMGRMMQHAREKGWWPQVDHIQIEHFDNREDALAREAEVIAERRPPFNLALPRLRRGDTP